MKKLLIVTCTKAKNSEEFCKRPIFASLKKQCETNADVDFYIFKDNKRGLSACYNEILKDPQHLDKTVLFVHDDVILEDLFLYEKLISSPYSITGLAGAKTFNKSLDKLAWHIAADKNSFVGEVSHSAKDRGTWTTVFGSTESRALMLDGLFLCCKVKDLVSNELYFDEAFNFHFYDLAFCMRANSKKVTCGVLPVRVIHLGLGDSMLTEDWEKANIKFKEQYCK